MSNSAVKEILKKYQGGQETKTTSSQLQKNQNTINTYKTRLASSGVDPEEATDKRNWFEKWANLPQDQNFLFDIFELINRPQQALFTGWKNAQEGKDFWEGAKAGFTGTDTTQFKDILKNYGMEDREGKLDLVDVLGFAGDVFLDPMDIPFLPVSAANKGIKTLDTANDIVKGLDTASDTAKGLAAIDDVSKAIDFISPTQLLGRGVKKGIKGAANIADTGIESALESLDKLKGIEYGNSGSKWASELQKVGEGVGKLETYKAIKNNITTMFNTKLSKAARKSQKANDMKEALSNAYLNAKAEDITNVMQNTSEKLAQRGINKTVEEVDKDLMKIIDTIDDISMEKVISSAKDGTIKYNDAIYQKLVNIANDVPDDAEKLINGIKKGENGVLQLSEDWEKVIDKLAPEKLEEKVKRSSFLSKAEQREIRDLTALYEENAPEAIEAVRGFYTDANDFISQEFESMKNLGDKYRLRNIDSFAKHKMADDYKDNIMKLSREYGIDPKYLEEQFPQNIQGIGTGSKTLNARKYEMSAQEANKLKKIELKNLPGVKGNKAAEKFVDENIDLFDVTASSGIQEYINQMPKLAKNTQTIDDVLLHQGFGDLAQINDLKVAIREGKDVTANTEKLNKLLDNTPFRIIDKGKASYGFKKLDTDTKTMISNFLKSTGKKTGNDNLIKMAGQLEKLDNVAIDPTVLNIIKFNTNMTQKSEFGKMYNSLMNFFKKNSTASLTNQMNNITGNIANMNMAGMSMKDVAKYSGKSLSDLKNWEDILKRGVTNFSQLTDDEAKIYKNLLGFMENVDLPDKNTILKLRDIDRIMKDIDVKGNKNLYDKYVNFFATLNANEDRMFKYALYNYAMDNPKFIKNLGIESVDELGKKLTKEQMAGKAVSKVLFDPSDLTSFEQNVMRNVIPFYTFTKKNLAYQISNMGDNLQNYNKLMKSYNSVLSSFNGNEENISAYLKENMYIPLPSIDGKGNYKFLRAQLPFGDLTDLASDPLKTLVNRGNPFVKALYEGVGNVNTLTGNQIESYPGQKGNIGILSNIPVLNKAKFQQGIGNLTGVNTQFRMLDRLIGGYQENGIPGALTGSTTIGGNVDTDKLNRSYEQIDELKNLMKQYEQKGYQFSTMSELKKANENGTIAGLEALFNKYGITNNKKSNTGNKTLDEILNRYSNK